MFHDDCHKLDRRVAIITLSAHRFAYGSFQVAASAVSYTYGYLADTDLVETMATSHGHTATRTYDPVMPHITRVHNGFTGGRTISQYDYTYDALGRRTAIANSGEAFTFSNANDLAAFNLYGYNGRSEVTSAARYWGTDTGDTSAAVDGQQYAYAFDPIGNRITSAEGDTDRTATYTANELNQYSQRTVPGVKELAGTALTNATVTVNDLPTDRHGPWWRHAFEVDNAASAAYTQAVVCAVYNPPGTNDPDVVTSATGHVFVAETPVAFTYDDDGNLLSDGRFTYAWDAENRLISVTTRTDLPAAVPRIRLTHAYDHQSRRLATAREEWNGSAWQSAGMNRYVYDGWNVVAETRAASPANTNYYVWGLDLSGSLQGAGGIGGLLAVRKRLEDGTGLVCNFAYACDANGNVVQEIMRAGGSIYARYEYDPFGNTVVATGEDAEDNPFRFSTKWFDNDTGLGYWGYRWYSPGLGRWMSRDPLGAQGDITQSYVSNNPISLHDATGLRQTPSLYDANASASSGYCEEKPWIHSLPLEQATDPNTGGFCERTGDYPSLLPGPKCFEGSNCGCKHELDLPKCWWRARIRSTVSENAKGRKYPILQHERMHGAYYDNMMFAIYNSYRENAERCIPCKCTTDLERYLRYLRMALWEEGQLNDIQLHCDDYPTDATLPPISRADTWCNMIPGQKARILASKSTAEHFKGYLDDCIRKHW